MFIDASALIAMLTDEGDARIFAARLQSNPKRITSPVAVFEACAAVAGQLGMPVGEIEQALRKFLELMSIQVVSLPVQVVPAAIEALGRFGQAARHPAGLNTGDCLSYACARYYRLPLLYKGPKFAATDIEAA